jgi:hypothetical protein
MVSEEIIENVAHVGFWLDVWWEMQATIIVHRCDCWNDGEFCFVVLE